MNSAYRHLLLTAGVPALGLLLLAGCGSSGSSRTSSNDGKDTETPKPVKPAVVSDPEDAKLAPQRKPPAGKGNAIGRVLYDGKGAPNIEVQLCEEIRLMGGCSGRSYNAKTNKDGFYVIDKVQPGDYALAVRVFDSDKFLYPTQGVMSAAKYKVAMNESLAVPSVNLWKVDLKPLTPKNGTTVKTDKPQLSWKAYPGAANYKVSVTPKQGGAALNTVETSETATAPEKSLLNGEYQWRVEAYNAEGTKISELPNPATFKVAGQAGSNTVDLVFPKQDGTVAGAGIKLQWKAHPQADDYKVYLKGVKQPEAVLSFISVTGTSHDVPTTLAPDQYFWSVEVYKEGDKIAASALQRFTVK
jgi:hypothetical protein